MPYHVKLSAAEQLVKSFEHWAENPPKMSVLTGRNHRCPAHFKCAQTVVGQSFAGSRRSGRTGSALA